MNLFIDTPQRAVERLERERALADSAWAEQVPSPLPDGAPQQAGASAPVGAPQQDGPAAQAGAPAQASAPGSGRGSAWSPEPYSVAEEAYREEKAYDRRRARRRKRAGILRVLATLVLLPLAVLAVFCVSYALTCILNGASPDELAQLFAQLIARVEGFAHDLLPAV